MQERLIRGIHNLLRGDEVRNKGVAVQALTDPSGPPEEGPCRIFIMKAAGFAIAQPKDRPLTPKDVRKCAEVAKVSVLGVATQVERHGRTRIFIVGALEAVAVVRSNVEGRCLVFLLAI